MRATSFDHVALWVDARETLADVVCTVCGLHEIDRTDTFTLVGGDARQGKLTLFDAEGPRARGVLERIVLRVPDLGHCVERAWAAGCVPRTNVGPRSNGGVVIDAPGNVPLGLTQGDAEGLPDLDHVVLRVPRPAATIARFRAYGFEACGERLVVGDRYVTVCPGSPSTTDRPLLNHLALLVDSVDDTVREAERLEITVDRVVDAPNTVAAFVTGPDDVVVEYVEHKPGFALV